MEKKPLTDRLSKDFFYRFLESAFRGYFRFFHLLEIRRELDSDLTPPFIIASNHASYMDPIIISVSANRRITWMAWDRLFKIPLLGGWMRWAGVIPVDVERGGRNALQLPLRVLEEGGIFGIFPEGGLTQDGELQKGKTGIARIACKADVPIVPVTIYGGFRVFPKGGLPKPGKITVHFHPAIRPLKSRAEDRDYYQELTDQLMAIIATRWAPLKRREGREDRLIRKSPPPLRIYEVALILAPLFAAFLLFFHRYDLGLHLERWIGAGVGLGFLYGSYLAVDLWVLRQSYRTRAVRNFSPLLQGLLTLPFLDGAVRILAHNLVSGGLAPLVVAGNFLAGASLLGYLVTASFFSYFSDYRLFQKWIRGLCLALSLPYIFQLFSGPLELPVVVGFPFPQPIVVFALAHFSWIFDFAFRMETFPLSGLLAMAMIPLLLPLGAGVLFPHFLAGALVAIAILVYITWVKFRGHDGRPI